MTSIGRVGATAFARIAIVNRGEPAIRFIRALREFNLEHGTHLRSIALLTTADSSSSVMREADEVHSLGPAWVDRNGSRTLAYLDHQLLTDALRQTRAEAVWVGWGFVAEQAEFAELCERNQLVFLGPRPQVIRSLGDKVASKELARQAEVPVVPWSEGPVETLEAARLHADRIGYPLMIKAAAGGGGRGIRAVAHAGELEQAFQLARSEAIKAFGQGTLFLERRLERVRHVEVQVVADQHGTVWAAGVRDCSIQRRNQKVIEEAPCPVLSAELEQQVRQAAVRLCKLAGYTSVGTVEFLFEPASQRFYLLEVNTRLQVEHPVTEETTGLDLVKLQIFIAAGGRLPEQPPPTRGHAIEVRLNAEDPDSSFAPAPGRVAFFRLPAGPGVRVDSGVAQGDAVPPEFDSMVGKIIARGRDRAEALSRLRRALGETSVIIEGGATNKAYLVELLSSPEVERGEVDTGWLDRRVAEVASRPFASEALVQAAIEARDAEFGLAKARFLASLGRARPTVEPEVGHLVELRHGDQAYQIQVRYLGGQRYRLTMDSSWIEAEVQRQNAFERLLICGTERNRILVAQQGSSCQVEVNGVLHRLSRDEQGAVRASSPALVLSVAAKVGDVVSVGSLLAVLEAMKMEIPTASPLSGRVQKVLVRPGVQVQAGAEMFIIEPATKVASASMARLSLSSRAGSFYGSQQADERSSYEEVFRERCRRILAELRWLMLGYDIDPADTRSLLRQYSSLRPDMPPDDPEMLALELGFLRILVDMVTVMPESSGSDEAASARYFASLLRVPSPGAEKPPAPWLEALERLRGCYQQGDAPIEPAELLYWIHRSHQRMDRSVAVALPILERFWDAIDKIPQSASFKALLDQLILVTHERFLAVSELARQLRFRAFELPLIEKARSERETALAEQFIQLVSRHGQESRRQVITELVDSPQPILHLLHAWFEAGDAVTRPLILEVYLRRFYRDQKLRNLQAFCEDGFCQVLADYSNARRESVRVLATYARLEALQEAVARTFRVAAELPSSEYLLFDFLVHVGREQPLQELSALVMAAVNATQPPQATARLCVSLLYGRPGIHLTLRPSPEGFVEEQRFRGIHHMQASRVELWRMKGFDTVQQAASENSFVFRAVARDNPKDVRLFAFLDVRDLSPVRDEQGKIVALPYLESLHTEAMASLRELLYRSSGARLSWNRVYIHSWLPLQLDPDELDQLARRLAVPTRKLGIEKIVIRARMPDKDGKLEDTAVHIGLQDGMVLRIRMARPSIFPIRTHNAYRRSVVELRRRGLLHPYEIVRMLTPASEGTSAMFPVGSFSEYDLDTAGELVPVERDHGENTANVVVGLITSFTARYPEGMRRVVILGDPSREMGALAEPECRRVIAALDLAEHLRVPVEWFPVSAGAKISMESGTENLDWTARVLRRLIEFTQRGGEVNVVVAAVNVGAQSYWNAEATMLMHTRGILVMTPQGSMVLTGKRALDISGSVSAANNRGIGGSGIMVPNGQVHYEARDITHACFILFQHYDFTYVMPGERFPRRARTRDPHDRDITTSPHPGNGGSEFTTVGQIFSPATNAGRKKPFSIRAVMNAVVDQDQMVLERWGAMRNAETAVVYDAFLGGIPVCLVGSEGQSVLRLGFVPGDGPDAWCGGTLYPLSSKKVARALNAASGNRPVVILANLAGFDGSPESMRKLQLEYGAEIGRSLVNFDGPIIFCAISRYHGGAFVVFSRALNENLEVAALEGAFASVIGGAPAAEVVFAGEVKSRVHRDPRVKALKQELASAGEAEKLSLFARLNDLLMQISIEKKAEVAVEFDTIHSIQRAQRIGSLHHIVPAAGLRAFLIEALERGMRRFTEPDRSSSISASRVAPVDGD